MSIAIMQPYVFPYLGYFHLIESVEKFVFFDDVSFIRRGWVNRNRILLNASPYRFSIPVSGSSQNRPIFEIRPMLDARWKRKFFKTLHRAYRKAPMYDSVMPLISQTLEAGFDGIDDLAIRSIEIVYTYLGGRFDYLRSKEFSPETRPLKGADRLIAMAKKAGDTIYRNAVGGRELYDREYFLKHGIELSFVRGQFRRYTQFGDHFVPGLSIIDVLMFNDKDSVRMMLQDYSIL